MGRTPKSVVEIYEDFQRRRQALLNALTDDVEEFYQVCDPARENLCLYGMADGTWKVDLPAAEVPPELPEPVLGINFARNGMERKDWLALCAVHSDAWLMSVLFFYGARFDDEGRAGLFSLVNQHPTVFEIVTGRVNRNTMYKRKQLVGGRGGYQTTQQPQVKKERTIPYVSADKPLPTGKLLTPADISPALNGRQAELYWPDDGKWYLVFIQSLDMITRQAMVQYATGEEETLDIDEVVNEQQMRLLP